MPLCVAEAEDGPFRVILCAWVDRQGVTEIRSLSEMRSLIDGWDGSEPSPSVWSATQVSLEGCATKILQDMRQLAVGVETEMRQQQLEAARLRLLDELGRTLICFEPDTDDLNGKFYRLASQSTPTATRLRRVMERLGNYPDWDLRHIVSLRDFRETLNGSQLKARLTGRELDAALDDPRWAFAAVARLPCWSRPATVGLRVGARAAVF
jgi:hypothetical protein